MPFKQLLLSIVSDVLFIDVSNQVSALTLLVGHGKRIQRSFFGDVEGLGLAYGL